MDKDKALVVFSGGQDSTTCLFHAMAHYKEAELVTFQYGQRHSLEIDVAKNIAEDQGLKHHVLDMSLLSQLSPNALTRHDIKIEEGEVPNTFVPACKKYAVFIFCFCPGVSDRSEDDYYWCL